MKYLIVIVFIILFGTKSFCQKEKHKNFHFGVFLGEGTGLAINKNVFNNLYIEWNAATHEFFYKYNFTDKIKINDSLFYQKYDNIYSTSLILFYANKFSETSKIYYHIGFGGQIRIIHKYYYKFYDAAFPEPNEETLFNLGINPLLGLDYKLSDKFSTYIDCGAYIEMAGDFDEFLWYNLQFRIGLNYLLNKNQ